MDASWHSWQTGRPPPGCTLLYNHPAQSAGGAAVTRTFGILHQDDALAAREADAIEGCRTGSGAGASRGICSTMF